MLLLTLGVTSGEVLLTRWPGVLLRGEASIAANIVTNRKYPTLECFAYYTNTQNIGSRRFSLMRNYFAYYFEWASLQTFSWLMNTKNFQAQQSL